MTTYTTEYDPVTHATAFVALDGENLDAGPVCRAKLGVNAGYSFHGFFDAQLND